MAKVRYLPCDQVEVTVMLEALRMYLDNQYTHHPHEARQLYQRLDEFKAMALVQEIEDNG